MERASLHELGNLLMGTNTKNGLLAEKATPLLRPGHAGPAETKKSQPVQVVLLN
jgi:hypothetical protein